MFAPAIASTPGRVDAAQVSGRRQEAGCFDVADQEVAFCIRVWSDVMGDRPGVAGGFVGSWSRLGAQVCVA
jgi:hypothetical protein